jgi:hypothetical protein
VRLVGWCAEEKALVLELCSAGSLDVALPTLTWYQRIRVATHVARALLFLHMRRPEVSARAAVYIVSHWTATQLAHTMCSG